MEDFYELLGVPRGASDDDLKKAYRKLARELHPDANPGDAVAEERFKKVTLAYETLRDPESRRRYDMFGAEGVAGTGASGQGGAQDPFGGFGGGGGLGDLFDAFFGGQGGGGGQRRSNAQRRGPDLETSVQLDFTEAIFGANKEVTVRAPVICSTCQGNGAKPGTNRIKCATCSGTGEVRRVRQSILGQMVTASPCPTCGGLGETIPEPCADCRGDGRKTEERTYLVEVPPGVDDGATLRLGGRGGAASRGGANGDLYVHLRVARHEVFRRDGSTIHGDLHIAMTQAALGATIAFETLDGEIEITVAAGTQSGKAVRFKGKGVPSLDNRGRGELIVHIIVDTPTQLTKVQDELMRQLAGERKEAVDVGEGGIVGRLKNAFVK